MSMHLLLLIIPLLLVAAQSQQTQSPGIIETRRIAFGSSNAMIFNQTQATYALQFERTFSVVPRLGLAVYSLDFEYSPTFSTRVTNGTTTRSATLQVSTSNTGQNNQLYLMYMATDHPYIGIFMPAPLITDDLNQRLQSNQQVFQFNYKEVVSSKSVLANIRLSVYLTGISTNSELTSNGYAVNRTYFKMEARKLELPFYSIVVEVQSMFGDITISQVEYTVLYFDVSMMSNQTSTYARYMMDAGVSEFSQFGGTSTPSSQSNTLPSLTNDTSYQSNVLFYGISSLDCSRGASISISAYPTIYNNSNIDQFMLNAQTWKLSFISLADYSFVQYMTLKCELPGANCDNKCQTSSTPHFIVNSICSYCHYSCLTCNVSNSVSVCDSCDVQTRILNNVTRRCDCLSGFYDPYQNNYTCQSCFPCKTCSSSNKVCLTCLTDLRMIKNSVLSTCECVAGFYPNYVNGTTLFNKTTPCLACPPNCLICLNSTYCLACDLTTYLLGGSCIVLCSQTQLFNSKTSQCQQSASVLFDQNGRLGFEWNYIANQSALNITLTFSQPNVLFYYYENQTGYGLSNSQQGQGTAQNTQFFYDDGSSASSGYQNAQNTASSSSSGALNSKTALSSNAEAIQAASGFVGKIAGNTSNIQGFNYASVKINDIDGTYLGLSQQYYYYLAYQYYQRNTGIYAAYGDRYGIPFGKVNISSSTPVKNQNFREALSNNLEIKVGKDIVPYQITASSNNQFILIATVDKSYYGEIGTITLKNPGLVRSSRVASQLVSVSKPVYIYVCGVQSYVSSAKSLYQSNQIIVGVLWGVGKYPLFVGFGWIFMPLMLVLQYITSLNYISSQKPLNLDLFLQSFADFKNPSILYNPLRSNMDYSVVNHGEIYSRIPFFYRFDRGIDFMKNCLQYFFVPLLSVLLYVVLIAFNYLLNICCRKDIPLISHYLKSRILLNIAAYTLVQAIGVSFFFFAQLNDTKYSSANQPNASYPVFNVAMAYLSFFLTCNIPLLLLAYLYFNFTNKQTKINSGSQLILIFNTAVGDFLPTAGNKAFLCDPLWTQKPQKPISYGFAGAVFFMPIVFGFFTAFFYDDFPWQLTGLILTTALFGFFAFANSAFNSTLMKYFWFLLALLLLAFLFLLSALGSNISGVPCGQQNIGYLGIGILYALVLLGVVASCYLLWSTFYKLYNIYFHDKHFIVNLNDKQIEPVERQAERTKSMKERTIIKSQHMKSKISNFQRDPGADFNGNRLQEDNPDSSNRLRQEEHEDEIEEAVIIREKLKYLNSDPKTGDYTFISEKTQTQYRFSQDQGRHLYNLPRLYITNDREILDADGNFVDRYVDINVKPVELTTFQPFKKFASDQQGELKMPEQRQAPKLRQTNSNTSNFVPLINIPSYESATKPINLMSGHQEEHQQTINIYIVDGQQYEKIDEDSNGNWILRDKETKQIRRMRGSFFRKMAPYRQQEEPEENVVHSEQKIDLNSLAQAKEFIAPDIESNQVKLQNNRKIKYNNQEYMNIGTEGDGTVRLYNLNTKKVEKYTLEIYHNIFSASFSQRINFNGKDYDVQPHNDGTFELVDVMNPNKRRQVTGAEMSRLKQQNQYAFITTYLSRAQEGSKQISLHGGRNIEDNVRNNSQQEYRQPNVPSSGNNKYSSPSNNGAYQPSSLPSYSNQLLLQSKATRDEHTLRKNQSQNNQYSTNNQNEARSGTNSITNSQKYISNQQIETRSYGQKQVYQAQVANKQEIKIEINAEDQDLDDGLDEIINGNTGPFKILVFDPDKVTELEDEEVDYVEEEARERVILQSGKELRNTKIRMEKKYPNTVMLILDMTSGQMFRIN